VKVIETDSFLSFISIRKAAEFIDIHPSYLAKTLKLSNFYTPSHHYVLVFFLIYDFTSKIVD
jgi:hypothetical protein